MEKDQLLLTGYGEIFEEIQMWIGKREEVLKEAWEKLGFLLVGLAAQAGGVMIPFVTVVGYAFPWYVDVLVKRWNRYNQKIGEKAKIRRLIEEDMGEEGVEVMGARAPSTGVKEQAKREFGMVNLVSITTATMAWLVRMKDYPDWINLLCGVAGIAVSIRSITSWRSIFHNRD